MNRNFKVILFMGLLIGLSGCGSSSSEEATAERGPVTQQGEEKVASILTKENYVGMAHMQYTKELSSATYASRKELFSLNIPSEKRVDVSSSYKTYNNQKVFNEMTISNNGGKLSFTVSDDKSVVSLILKNENQVMATTTIPYEEFINFLPTQVE